MHLPIKTSCTVNVDPSSNDRVDALVKQLILERPELDPKNSEFVEQQIKGDIGTEPALQIDDFSEIPIIGVKDNSPVLQQRARLRAVGGDYVVQSRQIEEGFSDYCEYDLGLGRVHWLYPAVTDSNTHNIALACWQDRRLRHDLEQGIRHGGLRYIHPHISTVQVWELAALLTSSTRIPVRVIGPPPELAKWANDKIEFSAIAARLLGEAMVPCTSEAYNLATLAKEVSSLAAGHHRIGIKFPNGTGGTGNFLIRSEVLKGKSLTDVRRELKRVLEGYHWPQGGRLLVDVWESEVINSPSVQTWIPPDGQGPPVIEGVFVQDITGEQGNFVGTIPSTLPLRVEQKIVNDSYLLASLFQRLGYVGRCSFDLILVGDSLNDCRIEFIECNARWGGTSTPMTLVNRLGIANLGKTYCVRKIHVPRLDRIDFAKLKRLLGDKLFDPATGRGRFILFNPAGIKFESSIDAIAISDSLIAAEHLLNSELPSTLERIVRRETENALLPTEYLMGHADFD